MKSVFIFLAVLATVKTMSQSIDTSYFPEYNQAVARAEYNNGKHILSNTYEQIEGASNGLVYADYWNVAVAYSKMGVENETVLEYLMKAKSMDAESFCSIVQNFHDQAGGRENSRFYKRLGEPYRALINDCMSYELKPVSMPELQQKKAKMDLSGLNESLIDRLIICIEKDNRYRFSTTSYKDNLEKQRLLDLEVTEELTRIFKEFGYPGKDLVGQEWQDYTAIMMEHSASVAFMEKYLPMVAKAFQQKQLSRAVFKMLLDRIHWRKTGKQLFGSQAGAPFDSDEVILRIRKKYGL